MDNVTTVFLNWTLNAAAVIHRSQIDGVPPAATQSRGSAAVRTVGPVRTLKFCQTAGLRWVSQQEKAHVRLESDRQSVPLPEQCPVSLIQRGMNADTSTQSAKAPGSQEGKLKSGAE